MATLHISPEAQRDLQDIKRYIGTELESPDTALKVIAKIFKAIRDLDRFPEMGAPLSSVIDIRSDYRFIISGSYHIFYRCDSEAIYILRVLYGRRDYMKILFS